MIPFFAQIERDLLIAWENRQDLAVMLIFFVIIISLFPLAIGSNVAILDPLAVPIIWIAALLSILAGFDRLFAQDVSDGWLDQVSLSKLGLGWYALAKAISHWLSAGLPLLIMTPIMAVMLNISVSQIPQLMVALLFGSMGLTLLGVIGAALAEGARRGAALMALLILPLAIPLLIFGTLASQSETGIISPHLMLLGAVFLVLLTIAPLVAAIALETGETETGL
ncbi:heme exporter protein CcmB [Candidatus Puniceispirillum sp.]|nr:heme exporter protein CcmB [Candidatus Puniceispirillum sp.]